MENRDEKENNKQWEIGLSQILISQKQLTHDLNKVKFNHKLIFLTELIHVMLAKLNSTRKPEITRQTTEQH